MSSQSVAQDALRKLLQSNQSGIYLDSDLLRAVREEASLMYETELLRNSLVADHFQQHQGDENAKKKIENLARKAQVVDICRSSTRHQYSLIHATVKIAAGDTSCNGSSNQRNIYLHFNYEREAEDSRGLTVHPGQDLPSLSYYICLSLGVGEPRTPLMLVHVWADGHHPNRLLPASNLEERVDSDDDGWEDVSGDDDTTGNSVTQNKRARMESPLKQTPENDALGVPATETSQCPQPDRFTAAIDPDLLASFLQLVGLAQMSEDAAFFLLMSFPFYESEWDIVGFVLDAVFGFDEEGGTGGECA